MNIIKNKKIKIDIKKIIIRGLNWTLGDTLMSFPLLQAIRDKFPKAQIDVAVPARVARLYHTLPIIDNIIILNQTSKITLSDKINFIKHLRREKYQLGFILQRAFEGAFFFLAGNVKYRIGYNSDYRNLILTNSLSEKDWDLKTARAHQIDYFLDLMRAFFADSNITAPAPLAPQENAAELKSLIEKAPIIKNNNYFLFSAGTSYGTARYWLTEYWLELINMINKKYPDKDIIFAGAPFDQKVTEEICSKLTIPFHNLTGKTSMGELISLVKNANYIISIDNGIPHLRAMQDLPYTVLYGSTNEIFTGPYFRKEALIKKNLWCSPCFERQCPRDNRECMSQITPQEVFLNIKNNL